MIDRGRCLVITVDENGRVNVCVVEQKRSETDKVRNSHILKFK